MKYIISIFIYISGIISFLILGSITLLLTFIFKPQQYDKFVKFVCRLLIRIFFIKVKVEGIEKVDITKTYIFNSNHINIFDPFILYGYIPNFARGVELDSHFNWPVWGTITRKFGNIPISHKNMQSAIQSLEIAKQKLREGVSIIILPEGHRTRTGKLRDFMKGPFHLAHNAKADIIPIAMIGAYEIKKVTSFVLKPGSIVFRFGDVIPYSFYYDMTVEQLRDYVKSKIVQLLNKA